MKKTVYETVAESWQGRELCHQSTDWRFSRQKDWESVRPGTQYHASRRLVAAYDVEVPDGTTRAGGYPRDDVHLDIPGVGFAASAEMVKRLAENGIKEVKLIRKRTFPNPLKNPA